MRRISTVSPAYNEYENIEELVVRLYKAMCNSGCIKLKIVVTNDNMIGRTAEAVEAPARTYLVRVDRRSGELGLDSAFGEGVKIVREDLEVKMNSNLQHPIEATPVARRLEDDRNAVIALRYTNGGRLRSDPLLGE